jgi:predicted choloylglycine hydrolase
MVNSPEEFHTGGSHFEVGLAIGKRFAGQIGQALDHYPFLQERLLPYHHSPEGQARYEHLVALHQTRYRDYLSELEGMAKGAGRPFEEVFLVNMRGEYAGYLQDVALGCSDCAIFNNEVALLGHNEDGSPAFRGNLYLIRAQIEGKPGFTALSYPGFLCGNAFGFNEAGVCFSVDYVRPRAMRVGVGRHFLARSLLEAHSLEDAIGRVTAPGRASGFSYTIGSIPERRMVHVEVAPQAHHVRELHGVYYHANHYRELDGVAQIIEASSRARVERADTILKKIPVREAADILTLLGDESDPVYPIYRTATPPDGLATLCTALFDLDARRLRIYTEHPTQTPGAFLEMEM